MLRPLAPDDLQHLLSFALQEPDTWQYSLTSAGSEKAMQDYIHEAWQSRQSGTAYPFIVYDKIRQQYAGSTRYYDIQHHHLTTQLGYTWYGKAFRATGLNNHCKFLLLQYAFEHMHCMRVELRADARNARSIAAMKKIGAVPEGILRSNCTTASGRRDSIVLSILAEEWKSNIKNNLTQLCAL